MEITVCIGSSCHAKQARTVVEQLQDLILQHDLNDQIQLIGTFCMGRCQEGVCVTVDGAFHSLSPRSVSKFFETEVLEKLR